MGAATIKRLVPLALFAVALGGCSGDMDDLDQYVNKVKSRSGGRIEPLPEIKPYEVFNYVADEDGYRSPFVPDAPQRVAGAADGVAGPREDRSREFLEQFPLDTLRMVGTLSQGGSDFGLIQTSDGLIHRVIPGNYIGQNDGRITSINESEIELIEIISDGIGGYVERDAAVGLAD